MFCYDISNPKRLRNTSKILENYGIRVQKSFFQVEIDKKIMFELRDKILKVIDTKKDYFFIYPLCDKCSRNYLKDGQGDLIEIKFFEVL
jgi:CRISPR-associated protein Cas2